MHGGSRSVHTPQYLPKNGRFGRLSIAKQGDPFDHRAQNCSSTRLAVSIPSVQSGDFMRVFPIALLAVISPISAFAQVDCGSLLKQTQAFSDAGQRSGGAAMAMMLDPDVIFFNETGEKATHADIAAATAPAAGSPIRNFQQATSEVRWRRKARFAICRARSKI
jgi:hypothetical protein